MESTTHAAPSLAATMSDRSPASSHQPSISSTGASAIQEISFGSFAGTIGKLIEFPFDTIKVRLQSQPSHSPPLYTGPLDCFRQSLANDGVRSLYRGVSAPLAGAAAETACLFYTYGLAQAGLQKWTGREKLGLPALVTAGAISGGLTATILTPIELVKCRMQVPLHSPADLSLRPGPSAPLTARTLSPFAVIRDVWRREGVKGFWRGHTGTFLRETGGTAAWFGGFEATTLLLKRRLAAHQQAPILPESAPKVDDIELPVSSQLLAGAIAGVSYNFLFYPADTIKSKIQTGELSISGAGGRPGFLLVGREIWRANGLRGLYRGCGITVARSAPSSALIFTIVGELKRAFS